MSSKEIILRPYQEDIIEQTVTSEKSTLIQIPTGGGKTVIAKFIIFKLWRDFNFQILFVAPKIVLMEQTMEVFDGLNPKLVHGQSKYTNRDKILVSTIQTASRRESLQPDVIIIDEVHYGFDGSMIEKLIKNKPNTRVIGLSATPYDRKGKLLKGFDLILDKYDMKYMIERNFLVPLKTFVLVKQDLSHIKITAGDYNLGELSRVVCNKNTILEIVKTTEKYILESKKTIVFAVDIAHAELLTKAYTQNGFKTKALHSKMKKDEVYKEIETFKKSETKVLVSVLMLTTGFDVPDTDCAVIARPTKSQNLYKQMVGRVLRKADNKKYAILLDCGNVVENLGMPLDPIREIDGNIIQNRLKCSQCQSEKLKLFKKDKKVYWKCKDCGSVKEIKQATYKCMKCKKEHTYKSTFRLTTNKLFLDCICGEETLISSYVGDEKFVEIKEEEQEYLSFEEARKFVHGLKLEGKQGWKRYCLDKFNDRPKKPLRIPRHPNIIYKGKGWINIEDWTGTTAKLLDGQNYLSFEDARSFIHKHLKLSSKKEWKKYCIVSEYTNNSNMFSDYLKRILTAYSNNILRYNINKPINIPSNPEEIYKLSGWINYPDWLGIQINEEIKIQKEKYLPFNEARDFVHKHIKLSSKGEWKEYCIASTLYKNPSSISLKNNIQKPITIPSHPEEVYKSKGWIDYNNWLDLKVEKYLSFEKARKFVHKLKLEKRKDWKKYCNGDYKDKVLLPLNIPRNPHNIYLNKGWKNTEDWIGVEKKVVTKKGKKDKSKDNGIEIPDYGGL